MSGGECRENRRKMLINIARSGMQALFQFQIRAVLTQAYTANVITKDLQSKEKLMDSISNKDAVLHSWLALQQRESILPHSSSIICLYFRLLCVCVLIDLCVGLKLTQGQKLEQV